MASGRPNKFKTMYNSRKESNLTEDLVEQLYEHEEKQEVKKPATPAKPIVEPKVETVAVPVIQPIVEVPVQQPKSEAPKQKKVGRPKKTDEDRSMFNFRISESIKEKINIGSSAKGLSKTDYIEFLINQDYAQNQQYYEMVKSNMKQ
ncbi:hypothetical protein bpr_IV198 (plasmid) [Butyrivibrio proteoclasticus B316]|uniref:Uncharacterized protein n=1 Tax=Butyrivibrio proteoclasticus (strain ATCC 51982 / DSM 14932 / B316) TaxID=515622 RepID=E0S580_BUTPB|nr:hypothetical protein [Butyrivibrio proteoclasticus]ADL36562.1 hypothetical protein bpr_IV198 [Butyrivibrio proteoclasticus B316]